MPRPPSAPDAAPVWAARDHASGARAFLEGMRAIIGVPAFVLVGTSLGFGALARASGLDIGQATALAALLYALPAQAVFADQVARGAGLVALMLAIAFTAIRLIPMTVVLVPHLKGRGPVRWPMILAVHFVAITAWIEGLKRLPHLPDRLRVPHYPGIGTGLMIATMIGTAIGYELSSAVPAAVKAALIAMTPIYFLLSLIGKSRTAADITAIVAGGALGPAMFLAVPGFDLLATGLIGGTVARLVGRGSGQPGAQP